MMTEVKLVISHLCKVFNGLFNGNIKPEHLRLCKFDKNSEDVISLIWNLLHSLSCPFITKENNRCAIDTVSCVKLAFASFKYNSLSFFNLPTDMTSGSRELLLALGWYLSTNRFQWRIKQYISDSILQAEYPYQSDEGVGAIESMVFQSEDQMINYINWVSGRIKNNITYILNLSSELVTLTSRVHKLTEGAFGLPHLSVMELLLLRDHNRITQSLDEYKLAISILENYLLWTKKQNVFWSWLENIVREDRVQDLRDPEQGVDKFIDLLKAEIRKQALKDNRESNGDEQRTWRSRMMYFGSCTEDRSNVALNRLIDDVERQVVKLKKAQLVKSKEILSTWNLMVDEDRQDDSSR